MYFAMFLTLVLVLYSVDFCSKSECETTCRCPTLDDVTFCPFGRVLDEYRCATERCNPDPCAVSRQARIIGVLCGSVSIFKYLLWNYRWYAFHTSYNVLCNILKWRFFLSVFYIGDAVCTRISVRSCTSRYRLWWWRVPYDCRLPT